MDIERNIERDMKRIKEEKLLDELKESNVTRVYKRFGNSVVGIEATNNGSSRKYVIEFNRNILRVEVEETGGVKLYKSLTVKKKGSKEMKVTRSTFLKYYLQFKEIIELLYYIKEEKIKC